MLNIIIGNNASGKTMKLNELIRTCSHSYASTELPYEVQKLIPLNIHLVEIVEEALIIDELVIADNDVVAIKDNNRLYSLNGLCRILTTLCKDTDYAFIDGPESYISVDSINFLQKVFYELSWCTNKEIWITTHCSDFLDRSNVKIFRVIDNSLVECTGDYDEDMHSF